jgi:Raf kinase inhibitor-like YbhB/YbcL family protein
MMPSMRAVTVLTWLALAAAAAGCGGGEKLTSAPPPAPRDLSLRSADFAPGGPIPAADTCDGARHRPALAWHGIPAAARELALVVTDEDAGGFVHWTVYGLDPRTTGLRPAGLPPGAREGENSFGGRGWGAPCPPKGKGAHRYVFDLYWLRGPSHLDAGAKPSDVVAAVGTRAGGRGRLVGRYARS